MLPSPSFTVLNPVTILSQTIHYPPMALIALKVLALVIGEDTVFHLMHERNPLARRAPPHSISFFPTKDKGTQGAYSGSAVVEQCVCLMKTKFHMLALEMQRFWLWVVDPLREKWMNRMNTDRGARPENNLERSCVY